MLNIVDIAGCVCISANTKADSKFSIDNVMSILSFSAQKVFNSFVSLLIILVRVVSAIVLALFKGEYYYHH
jgi:hypothetical protein